MNLRTHLQELAVELDNAAARKNFGKNFSTNNSSTSNKKRESAVLVMIKFDSDNLDGDIIMIRRASNPRDPHSGQLSFPGGMLESIDNNNPIKTALRETREEIGIPHENIQVMCTMKQFTVNTGVSIVPVLGILEGEYRKTWCRNPKEVAAVLKVRWSLLAKSQIRHIRYGSNGWENMQAYKSSIGLIWGASARILFSLIKNSNYS